MKSKTAAKHTSWNCDACNANICLLWGTPDDPNKSKQQLEAEYFRDLQKSHAEMLKALIAANRYVRDYPHPTGLSGVRHTEAVEQVERAIAAAEKLGVK